MAEKPLHCLAIVSILMFSHESWSRAAEKEWKEDAEIPISPSMVPTSTSHPENKVAQLSGKGRLLVDPTGTTTCTKDDKNNEFCPPTTDATIKDVPVITSGSVEELDNIHKELKSDTLNIGKTDDASEAMEMQFSATPSLSFSPHSRIHQHDAQIRTIRRSLGKKVIRKEIQYTEPADDTQLLRSRTEEQMEHRSKTPEEMIHGVQDTSTDEGPRKVSTQHQGDEYCINRGKLIVILTVGLVSVAVVILFIYFLRTKCKRTAEDNSELKAARDELGTLRQQYIREVDSLKHQLQLTLKDKDEALSRLSEVAGRRLRENNPTIADLSTENRPTKIAERYKELYDNEWTEAFSELGDTHNKSDQDAIQFLLKSLQDAYEFCREKYNTRRKHLSLAVTSSGASVSLEEEVSGDAKELSDELTDLVKQMLKASSHLVLEPLIEEFLNKDKDFKFGASTTAYIRKCVEITWFMNVQLPPMALDDPPPRATEFDRNIYSVYTVSGRLVDYVVWPVCRVEKHGLLLSKGILQPIKS